MDPLISALKQKLSIPISYTTHKYKNITNSTYDLLELGILQEDEQTPITVYSITATDEAGGSIFDELIIEYYPEADLYYLSDIVVQNKYRKQGYGTKVIEACEHITSTVYIYASSTAMDVLLDERNSTTEISDSVSGWYTIN